MDFLTYLADFAACSPPYLLWGAFYTLLTLVVFPAMNTRVKSVRQWSESKCFYAKLDWNCRCSSILNSCIVTSLTVYALFVGEGLKWNDVHSTSIWAKLSMQICGGYFVSDAIVVTINRNYYPQISDFILHHIVSITAFMLVDKNQACLYLANIRLLSELSTPFVNCRWMLQQMNLRNSKLYEFNRSVTVYAYFVCRILPIPFYWTIAAINWSNDGYKNCDMFIKIIIFTSGIALDALNFNWFGKLTKGMRAQQAKKAEEKSSFERSEDPTEEGLLMNLTKMKSAFKLKLRKTTDLARSIRSR